MTTRPLPARPASTVASSRESSEFQTGQVFTIAGGHFVHDSFAAFLAPLLPIIRDTLAIGYTGAGGLAIFTQLPSLLTPFIGYLADRISLRYFVILAPATTATLMSLIGYAPDYMLLVMLLLAVGVSIAAFHAPAPAMVARTSGNRVGMGMSVFMASGELGRALGPIVVMTGVACWGLDGLWRLAIIGWLTSAVLYWGLHTVAARPADQKAAGLSHMWPTARRVYPGPGVDHGRQGSSGGGCDDLFADFHARRAGRQPLVGGGGADDSGGGRRGRRSANGHVERPHGPFAACSMSF